MFCSHRRRLSRRNAIAACVAATSAIAVAAGATAGPAAAAEDYYKITAVHSGLAVSISDLSTRNNEVARQRKFNLGFWNYQWTKTPRDGAYTFRTRYSRQCLTVARGDLRPGAHIVQMPCVSGDESQQWTLQGVGGFTYVQNVRSELVLTVASRLSPEYVFAENTELVQERLVGTATNQFFNFVKVARG